MIKGRGCADGRKQGAYTAKEDAASPTVATEAVFLTSMNRYDPCVTNKVIDGTQMTVAWHVDDLKVSHKKLSAIREFAALLNNEFGKETPISESYEKT